MCRFDFDDGVYILGALAPSERADYERHLPTCSSCSHSVARLAVLPGLLGRLDLDRAAADVQQPPTLLPRVLATAAIRRRADRLRRRWYSVAAGAGAPTPAAAGGLGVKRPYTTRAAAPPPALTSMSPSAGRILPVTAEIGLVAIPGGTRVEMRCRYQQQDEGTWTVRLVVYPRYGAVFEEIGSWIAFPGDEVHISAFTHLSPDQIRSVELQEADHTALLVWTPPT
jgi:hypothetical protein